MLHDVILYTSGGKMDSSDDWWKPVCSCGRELNQAPGYSDASRNALEHMRAKNVYSEGTT